MLPTRLLLLNFARWFRENALFWSFLSAVYSLIVTLILQPVVERFSGVEPRIAPLWAATCAMLLVPWALEALPLRDVPWFRTGKPGSRFFRFPGGELGRIYLRHELRRGATWLTLAITVGASALLPPGKQFFWLLIAQLPMQRALYSFGSWRRIALPFDPTHGARRLMNALWAAQFLQLAFIWLALRAVSPIATPDWLKLGSGALGAMIAAGSMSFEGDSGRPWIVNMLAFGVAIIAGMLSLYWPWTVLFVAYFAERMSAAVGGRLHSVEHQDEDTVIQ